MAFVSQKKKKNTFEFESGISNIDFGYEENNQSLPTNIVKKKKSKK